MVDRASECSIIVSLILLLCPQYQFSCCCCGLWDLIGSHLLAGLGLTVRDDDDDDWSAEVRFTLHTNYVHIIIIIRSHKTQHGLLLRYQ